MSLVSLLAALALIATGCGTRADRDEFYRSLRNSATTDALAGGSAEREEAVDDPGARSISPGPARSSNPRGPETKVAANVQTRTASNLSSKIVGKTVRVGIHIPITGAAPLPTDFLDYIRVIEEYVAKEAPIHGRTFDWVEVDDGYDPAKGQAACRKIAEEDVLFAVGHTMPAVQDGCAALFETRGIPYLMRGTYPDVVRKHRNAYFGTISDDRQGRLLADYALTRLGARSKKAAVVYQNDQTAARDNFIARIKQGGGSVVVAEQSVPRQPDYAATVQKLQQAGAQIVLLSMPPVDAIKLSVQAQGQGYHPAWLGGASHWNYNMVLESAGMALDGAIAFSPWASIDSSAANEFKSIFRKYRPGKEAEDIGLIIWGWYSLLRTALMKAGPDLSRASFADALDGLEFKAPYWNPLRYTPTDHMGPTSVAVFRADGQAKRWRQIDSFKSAF